MKKHNCIRRLMAAVLLAAICIVALFSGTQQTYAASSTVIRVAYVKSVSARRGIFLLESGVFLLVSFFLL